MSGTSSNTQATPSSPVVTPSSDLTIAAEPQAMGVAHKLNGSNYLQWSQSVLMYLRGKRKEKYINGEATQPSHNDPKFDTWFAENNQMMSWLCNSMTLEISEGYLLASTAKEIWDAAKRTYSTLDNTATLLDLKRQLKDLKQGNLTVTQYYSTLTKIWQQLDLFEVHPWKDMDDANYYRQLVERGRTYDFLLGLNDVFEEVRGRIMGLKPLPSLFEVFSMVKFEESRRHLTQGSLTAAEGSALVTRGFQTSEGPEKKGNKWCNHCNKRGHTRDECWKLHGKPTQGKQKQREDRKSHHTSSKKKVMMETS
ncbi:uncharacterized protein LOC114750846 [Neltuma alba]|uniref:uncharacterized protein LOC114750846 n=1 Tax=Neltuma alba TaxID=207710 RepID=UPI0010A31EDF|nr:uncharacterized protein LOC114750846 [Prosopis alba]